MSGQQTIARAAAPVDGPARLQRTIEERVHGASVGAPLGGLLHHLQQRLQARVHGQRVGLLKLALPLVEAHRGGRKVSVQAAAGWDQARWVQQRTRATCSLVARARLSVSLTLSFMDAADDAGVLRLPSGASEVRGRAGLLDEADDDDAADPAAGATGCGAGGKTVGASEKG